MPFSTDRRRVIAFVGLVFAGLGRIRQVQAQSFAPEGEAHSPGISRQPRRKDEPKDYIIFGSWVIRREGLMILKADAIKQRSAKVEITGTPVEIKGGLDVRIDPKPDDPDPLHWPVRVLFGAGTDQPDLIRDLPIKVFAYFAGATLTYECANKGFDITSNIIDVPFADIEVSANLVLGNKEVTFFAATLNETEVAAKFFRNAIKRSGGAPTYSAACGE